MLLYVCVWVCGWARARDGVFVARNNEDTRGHELFKLLAMRARPHTQKSNFKIEIELTIPECNL